MQQPLRTLFEIYPPDPAVTVPLGLRVNEVVYGLLSGGTTSMANSSDTRRPSDAAIEKLQALLDGAGARPSHIESITAACDTEDAYRVLRDRLANAFPGVDVASKVEEYVALSGNSLELHCRLRLPSEAGQITEAAAMFIEGAAGRHHYAGEVIGQVAFAPMIRPLAPDGTLQDGDSLAQLRTALRSAGAFLAAAGSGWHELARATVFMHPVDMHALNTAWAEIFPDPDDRAPHKYVPAALPEGERVGVQVLAVRGAPPRRVIELESIRHGDWMTMAALTGNIVTSSRVIASRRDDAAAYTQQVLENIEVIMRRAGGGLRDLQQITAFIGEPAYRQLVRDELQRWQGDLSQLPVLHFIEANLGGIKAPRMEILGLLNA